MKSGFATLIGIVIAIAILAFVMVKVIFSRLAEKNTLNQTANPAQIQKQVDTYQKQIQEKQRQQDIEVK